jgi:hypothetical protein
MQPAADNAHANGMEEYEGHAVVVMHRNNVLVTQPDRPDRHPARRRPSEHER